MSALPPKADIGTGPRITCDAANSGSLAIFTEQPRLETVRMARFNTARGNVAEASHVSSCPHAQFASPNLVTESADRGRRACDGLDIFFRI